MTRRLTTAFLVALSIAAPSVMAAELMVQPVEVTDWKAVYGRVETRDVVAARARIGGTLTRLDVSEGSAVTEGQPVALVVDDKIALQMRAADSRIRALKSEQVNARAEYERARDLLARGSGTQQRIDQTRAATEVLTNQIAAAEADRSVLTQQTVEGEVRAPATGRVLKAPVTKGSVVMPGEAVATIAGGGFFLRLALPERHARIMALGDRVNIRTSDGSAAATAGAIAKIFPQIENGRVIVDVDMPDVGNFFVGERVQVRVPIGKRQVLAVPAKAVTTRAGVDFVSIITSAGPRDVAVIVAETVDTPLGAAVEILTGLKAGDRVVVP
ncbi:MAG: efflux RND transporter periplasmic adaptor subunit [Beijerinckiaceae bacterium]